MMRIAPIMPRPARVSGWVVGVMVSMPAAIWAGPFASHSDRAKAECCHDSPLFQDYRSTYYGYFPTCWRAWPPGWGCPTRTAVVEAVVKPKAPEKETRPAAKAEKPPNPDVERLPPSPEEETPPLPTRPERGSLLNIESNGTGARPRPEAGPSTAPALRVDPAAQPSSFRATGDGGSLIDLDHEPALGPPGSSTPPPAADPREPAGPAAGAAPAPGPVGATEADPSRPQRRGLFGWFHRLADRRQSN